MNTKMELKPPKRPLIWEVAYNSHMLLAGTIMARSLSAFCKIPKQLKHLTYKEDWTYVCIQMLPVYLERGTFSNSIGIRSTTHLEMQ